MLSLYYTQIKTKSIAKVGRTPEPNDSYSKIPHNDVYHAFSNPDKGPLLSQDELRILYHNLQSM
jgi:hypothetical protein